MMNEGGASSLVSEVPCLSLIKIQQLLYSYAGSHTCLRHPEGA